MTTIAENLQAVLERIATACHQAGRSTGAVSLLAVSKTWSAEHVRAAARAGQRAFGESYVQEALPKQAALADLDLEWHFIGPLQANKTRAVAEHFAWVHSLDRLKLAERLNAQRPEYLPPLNCCLQVNVSGETSKSGCPPDEAVTLAQAIAALPRLRLRGLMTIPAPTADVASRRAPFARLCQLQQTICSTHGLALDTLSMGMSDDLEAAIIEGATQVRIGTAIFGNRQP